MSVDIDSQVKYPQQFPLQVLSVDLRGLRHKGLSITEQNPRTRVTSLQCLRQRAEITYQQSVLLRLKGNIMDSVHIIETFLLSLNNSELANGDLVALHLSQATNHAYCFNFEEAHQEIKKCIPVYGLPGKEEHLLWDQILCAGRILRGEGHFEEAKVCFESCLRTPGLRQYKRLLVTSALADVYCELDGLGREDDAYLSRANIMVGVEVEKLKLASSQHLKGYWRLLLSHVEIKIKQGYHDDAEDLIRELLARFGSLQEPDIMDRLGHVRALIAFARVSPSVYDALHRWNDVLVWNRYYNPLEEEVFTCAVVYLFLCITSYNLGDIDQSVESFNKAVRVVDGKGPQFLIPGVGTYLFHSVSSCVESTTGWRLPPFGNGRNSHPI
ncbi:hypothetical protein VE04_03611 [Pseudogymnoascus sp. 24MN13]|nr:hypothetical protein VE04_03598 [Pseudogymnoascus sp. 24MN13]OBT55426.1 hypothetical protein VE04_03611 [Pseudogymnoascus sp. 24MN13]